MMLLKIYTLYASHSADALFDARPGLRLFWLRFHHFPQALQANTVILPLVGLDLFLANLFQFMIHPLSHHSTCCTLAADSAIERPTKIHAVSYVLHYVSFVPQSFRGGQVVTKNEIPVLLSFYPVFYNAEQQKCTVPCISVYIYLICSQAWTQTLSLSISC
jgi:hypothetical protein